MFNGKSDRINRISRIFFCLHQFLPEIDVTQSTFGGKKIFTRLLFFFDFSTNKMWLPDANFNLPRRRRMGILCFIRK